MAGDAYVLVVQGLDIGGAAKDVERRVLVNAARAINYGADLALKLGKAEIEKQVAFPSGYLDGGGRIYVGTRATVGSQRAVIQARQRATSLARFTNGQVPQKGQGRQQGVYVTVKPGLAKFLRTAFLLPLRSGSAETLNNLGLAVRSAGKPDAAYKPKQIGNNLWLLYGPSVASVFQGEEGRGVRDLILDPTMSAVVAEFDRLMEAGVE